MQGVIKFEWAEVIQDFGFPIIAAIGLGYFVYYVWQWVTKDISPTISSSKKTLIELIDKVRMLDNDMIRLNIKLKMILQFKLLRRSKSWSIVIFLLLLDKF